MDFWCARYMLDFFFFFWNKTNLTYIAYGWCFMVIWNLLKILTWASHSITLKHFVVTLTQAMYVLSNFLGITWKKCQNLKDFCVNFAIFNEFEVNRQKNFQISSTGWRKVIKSLKWWQRDQITISEVYLPDFNLLKY